MPNLLPTLLPTILAIETSSELASCALLIGDSVLRLQFCGVRTHSQSILPMVQQLLQQAGIALKDCAAIAYGCGPGSFTGVRTACGIAQGLAFGASLPVVPVVTLAAMALACRQRSGANEVLAVLDARMGEVYWAQYAFDADHGCTVMVEPTLSAPADVPLSALPSSGALAACGNGLSAYPSAYAVAFEAQACAMHPDIMPDAAEIGQLARIAFRAGAVLTPAQAQPLYLRNKIAYTSAERDAMRAVQAGS